MSLKYAPVSVSGSGDNVLVAAVPGRVLRVLSYVMIAAGTVNATWKSGTGGGSTALSGALPLVAQAGVSSGPGPGTIYGRTIGHFETKAGEALNLNLSAAVSVAGHLCYDEASV